MTLVYLVTAWLAGIVVAQATSLPWQAWALSGLGVLAAVALTRSPRLRLVLACLLLAALGGLRLVLAAPRFDERSPATYNGTGTVTLEGVVAAEPDERQTYTNLRVRAERLSDPDGREVALRGLVLVRAPRYPRLDYGDRIRVEGRLEAPPTGEPFSYRDYLARQGIYSLMTSTRLALLGHNQANPLLWAIFALKRHAQATIATILPEPQAALLTGILLGIETGIPSALVEAFRATGTSHIVVISGFNMTLVAGILTRLALRLFDRRRAFWIAVAGVALYTVLVGASAAVVRAAAMALLCLWARRLGRVTYGPASLAAAALLMSAWNPLALWDISFQLSFAATAGLVLFADPLERAFAWLLSRFTQAERARRLTGLLDEALIVGLAAQITTTPLILFHFGRLSLVAMLSNLLILPAQPAVMIWGGLATLVGMVTRPLGQGLGWVAWAFLTYTIELVQLTARVPRASVPLHLEGWMVVAWYGLLVALAWVLAQPRQARAEAWARLWATVRRAGQAGTHRLTQPVLIGACLVLLTVTGAAWRTLPDGLLHILFLDVGQGDAIFIRTPAGHQVLVDGGPAESVLLAALGRHLPFWDRTLDLVVLTHPDSDHVTGLVGVLERYRVRMVMEGEAQGRSAAYAEWRRRLEREGAERIRGQAGIRAMLDGGVEIEWLYAGQAGTTDQNANNASLVARLRYGDFSVLLPGDIEAEVEERLVLDGVGLASTVLKVPHHGSCTSTSTVFLQAVDPQLAVISVGENDFGHPCAEVLARLASVPVYRTDQHGTVELISDGTRAWVRTGR